MKKLSLMERWSSSDNFFAQLSYETLNDFYVGLQVISLGAGCRGFKSLHSDQRQAAAVGASACVLRCAAFCRNHTFTEA